MGTTDPKFDRRWEDGIPHHPAALAVMKHMQKVDLENGLVFDLSTGGDGDNGETLLYLMDSYFEKAALPTQGLSFRLPGHPDDEWPQQIVLWDGRQVGIAIEMKTRWVFNGLAPSDKIARSRTLHGLSKKIVAYMEAWESEGSSIDGLVKARAIPGLWDLD